VLKRHKELISLDVSGTLVTEAAFDDIRKALPKVKTVR